MPVPAVEGVALTGGGSGLAHDAVGVGDALLEGLAGGELAAVSRVENVDLVLVCVLGPLGVDSCMVLAGDRLAEVNLVQVLLLVGEAGEVGDPVPAGEGVALAGGLCGLAHHAVGVGDALLEGLAGGELAAVSRVENVDLVLVCVLGPLGVDSCMVLAGDRLAEVNLVQVLLLVGEAGEVGDPVPACEGVAIAGGGSGLAHDAVGVGNALHGIVAVSELAAVSSVQDVDFVLVLRPLGIHRYMRLGNRLAEIDLVLLFLLFGEDAQVGNPIPAGEGVAITGGSRGLAHHAVGVGEALLNFLAVKELAAIGNIQNVGLVLYFILSPLSEHRNGLTSNRLVEIDLVGSLLLVGEAGEVGDPVPACEGVAIAGGGSGLAHDAVGVGNALHGFVAVYELAAVSSIQNVDLVLFRFLLVGLVVHIKRADALQGGGHVHFLFAGRYA